MFDLYRPEPRPTVPNLTGRCHIRIWNNIDRAMVDRVAEKLASAPFAESLTIDVDSFGGEAMAGFDIFALLDRHPATHKVAFGAYVNSAAILPLMAGYERIARRGASVVLHPTKGPRPDDNNWIDIQYAKIISARTGADLNIIAAEQETEEPSRLDWCLRHKIFTRTIN